VYYTVNHLCHMVLALKPFGCMPSTQSDGVQSRVVNKFKDMIFLPVETSGEGEVNAHSRVQMALAEAKAKARAEFDSVLAQTGKSLDDLQAYVEEHPELKHALYPVPHRAGIAGTAAQFALHADYPIYTMKEFTSLLSISSVGLLRNFIGVVIGISIVVGFIAVSMAMYTAVLERTRDIGMLKSLGASPALILNLFLKETFFLAVAGTGIGIVLTCITQWILAHLAHSSLTQDTVYLWWPIAGLIAVGGALLGTVAPAYKAVRQDVTEALSYE
ncbi:MAG: FtsX-like permease family protein, partial [Acidobacteriaceae bacterium]